MSWNSLWKSILMQLHFQKIHIVKNTPSERMPNHWYLVEIDERPRWLSEQEMKQDSTDWTCNRFENATKVFNACRIWSFKIFNKRKIWIMLNRFGVIKQPCGQNFAILWSPSPLDSFHTLSLDKNRRFLNPPATLVHAVIEWPLSLFHRLLLNKEKY